jgi:D-sedoheptulose 7-phosphate isomerase
MFENPADALDGLIAAHAALSPSRRCIWAAYEALERCFAAGGRLYICGNGGSAADALHIVGELAKSFDVERPVDADFAARLRESFPGDAALLLSGLQGALPAHALVENSALSSAFANDVRADMAFAQQVYGYGRPGDALLGISTSGRAKNVANAAKVAKAKGMAVIGLTGGSGGELASLCDAPVVVPETETYKIQELHLPVYHALCHMLELRFFGSRAPSSNHAPDSRF